MAYTFEDNDKFTLARLPWLNIYPQVFPHSEAKIMGNRRALEMLVATIILAISRDEEVDLEKMCEEEVLATDGEGYSVRVKLMSDDPDLWGQHPPFYSSLGIEEMVERINRHRGFK